MKSLFPPTPTMRYERMAAGALFAAICLLVGAQFASMLLQAAATTATLSSVLSWALASICFLSLGVAFSLFALCKAQFLLEPKYRIPFLVIRWFGLRMLWLALACSVSWFAINLLVAAAS